VSPDILESKAGDQTIDQEKVTWVVGYCVAPSTRNE
jgi:hypothetical protein